MLRPLPPAKALDVLKRKWERHFDKQVGIICSSPFLICILLSRLLQPHVMPERQAIQTPVVPNVEHILSIKLTMQWTNDLPRLAGDCWL